jgi:hypothetical protein
LSVTSKIKLCLGQLVYHDVKTEKKTLQFPRFEVLTESPEITLSVEDRLLLEDWLFQNVNLLLHTNKLQLVVSQQTKEKK